VPREASYGLVSGLAAPGTQRIVVSVRGRVLVERRLRHRRFAFRVALPTGALTLRVTAVAANRRHSVTLVPNVFGLPRTARPRFVAGHDDETLQRRIQALAHTYRGVSGIYLESLTDGAGAAWNARARFPAGSTLKLAIATTVLAVHHGVPAEGSYLDGELRQMLLVSDNAAANALETWLGGSTSGGSGRVNALMRSIGLRDTIMYGGYVLGTYGRRIPLEVEQQPAFGFGKYTTASDLAHLFRAVWLASAGRGPLAATRSGVTMADARYLLWLLGHVNDTPKLDRVVGRRPGVAVLHKAGWINAARHDAGLVFWRGGVFVASVLTWNPRGTGRAEDVLAGRCADAGFVRFRALRG
jgi:beta-lactamase class A